MMKGALIVESLYPKNLGPQKLLDSNLTIMLLHRLIHRLPLKRYCQISSLQSYTLILHNNDLTALKYLPHYIASKHWIYYKVSP